MSERCTTCSGRGWLGACRGGQFAYIGRLALSGRLPRRACPKCVGKACAELKKACPEPKNVQ